MKNTIDIEAAVRELAHLLRVTSVMLRRVFPSSYSDEHAELVERHLRNVGLWNG